MMRRHTKSVILWGILFAFTIAMPSKALAIGNEEVRKPGQIIQTMKVFSDILDAKKVSRLTKIILERLKSFKQYTILDPIETDIFELFMEHDCVEPDAECLSKIGKSNNSNVTLWVSVEREGKGPFVLTYKLIRNLDSVVLRSSSVKTKRSRALMREVKRMVSKIYGKPSATKLKSALLKIETNVAGATVFLDDENLGSAPVEMKAKVGQHDLRVEKDGYEVYRKTIFVHRTKGFHGVANLKPVQVVVTDTGEKVLASDIPEEIEEEPTEIYQQWWFWTGAAVVVSGTVATIIALSSSGSPATGGTIFSLDPTQVENDAVFSLP